MVDQCVSARTLLTRSDRLVHYDGLEEVNLCSPTRARRAVQESPDNGREPLPGELTIGAGDRVPPVPAWQFVLLRLASSRAWPVEQRLRVRDAIKTMKYRHRARADNRCIVRDVVSDRQQRPDLS